MEALDARKPEGPARQAQASVAGEIPITNQVPVKEQVSSCTACVQPVTELRLGYRHPIKGLSTTIVKRITTIDVKRLVAFEIQMGGVAESKSLTAVLLPARGFKPRRPNTSGQKKPGENRRKLLDNGCCIGLTFLPVNGLAPRVLPRTEEFELVDEVT